MKKYYIKPSIATMEIETTSIMAGSMGVDGSGSQGGIDTQSLAMATHQNMCRRASTSTRGSMMTTATKSMTINNTLQRRG